MNLKDVNFEAWLAAQPNGQVVGQPRVANNCPITTWVRGVPGAKSVSTNTHLIHFFKDGYWRNALMSPRQQRFVGHIDRMTVDVITREDALEAWREAGDGYEY